MRCSRASSSSGCLLANGDKCVRCNEAEGWKNVIFNFLEDTTPVFVNECFKDYDMLEYQDLTNEETEEEEEEDEDVDVEEDTHTQFKEEFLYK